MRATGSEPSLFPSSPAVPKQQPIQHRLLEVARERLQLEEGVAMDVVRLQPRLLIMGAPELADRKGIKDEKQHCKVVCEGIFGVCGWWCC